MNWAEFFFNANRFVPRGDCGNWNDAMAWVYKISNLAIFAAYMAIPILLLTTTFHFRKVIALSSIRIAFGAFILFCGLGHLEGAVSFFWPTYHFFAVWHSVTAAVSWVVVFLVWNERVESKYLNS